MSASVITKDAWAAKYVYVKEYERRSVWTDPHPPEPKRCEKSTLISNLPQTPVGEVRRNGE